MPFLVITDPFPTGFHIGPLQIRFYGIAYAIAFVVGTAVASRHLERRGVPPATSSNIAFWTIVFGLIGARLYFVVQSGWWWYLTHPQHILAIWEGGMAFFGAVFTAPVVLFGICSTLGPPSNLPWAIRYTSPETMAPHLGVAYQPANLYEAVGTLLILGVLLYLRRRGMPSGGLAIAYFILYPISQLILFNWRTDYETPVIIWGLKQAQLTSLFVLAVVVPGLLWFWRRSNRGRAQPQVAD